MSKFNIYTDFIPILEIFLAIYVHFFELIKEILR